MLSLTTAHCRLRLPQQWLQAVYVTAHHRQASQSPQGCSDQRRRLARHCGPPGG